MEGETEVIGENLRQCCCVHNRSHMTRRELEPGTTRWEADDKPPELRHGLKVFYKTRGGESRPLA
jgi:hypothetical protein